MTNAYYDVPTDEILEMMEAQKQLNDKTVN